MKVRLKTQSNEVFKTQGILVPTNTETVTTAWFAKGVGMAKSMSKMNTAGDVITELVSSN
jgi:hypothetical protein